MPTPITTTTSAAADQQLRAIIRETRARFPEPTHTVAGVLRKLDLLALWWADAPDAPDAVWREIVGHAWDLRVIAEGIPAHVATFTHPGCADLRAYELRRADECAWLATRLRELLPPRQ